MYNAGRGVASELPLILAPDVMVRFRGRRLGDTDGIGSRKGLLQSLLQRLIEPALLAVVGLFGLRAWCGHETTSSWHAVCAPAFGGWANHARCLPGGKI